MTNSLTWKEIDEHGMRLAVDEAKKSREQGGIPIGSVLLVRDPADPAGYRILGAGHNERIQKLSATLHGEISALENAGCLRANIYRAATIYTTLSPCSMCTGAILLYKIPRVVIGENKTYMGSESLLHESGVEVIVEDRQDCKDLMQQFVSEKPEEWNEDIGELVE